MSQKREPSSTDSTPNPASVPEGETVHTLESLGQALGPASTQEVMQFVDGHDVAALVKEGTSVLTPRVSTDAARMYGNAFDFLARARPEQLDLMPMFTRDFLRICVWSAQQGDALFRQLRAQSGGAAAKQTVAQAGVQGVHHQAEARRDQLHVTLVTLAGGEAVLLAQIATAYGSAVDVPGAIEAQVSLARGWMKSPPKGLGNRLKATRLDSAWLDRALNLARDARGAESAAKVTRSEGPLSLTEVHRLNGINLLLLRNVAAQFEAGHAEDPAIPRLQFNSLRAHVHRSHHSAPSGDGSQPAATPAGKS